MKIITLWSKSGHQKNAWRFTLYKGITNEGNSIADIARKISCKHGSSGWDGCTTRIDRE